MKTDRQKPEKIPLTNIENVRIARNRLMALRGMIEVKVNQNLLEPTIGKSYSQFINWQAIRRMSYFFMARAEKFHEAKNYRLSLHTYKNALKELERSQTIELPQKQLSIVNILLRKSKRNLKNICPNWLKLERGFSEKKE